ncbi:pilus assembly protein TadG-related protein [Aliiroseovarius sp. S1123]|uniref:TadE/TadG family type IV pilus assembly protein n=1 Tax=Aliiroseovarius sp. S1123 TaxID=2926404 RepID=UPI001FF3E6EF|nr:TadE/TadG family type IV pilus assembly protein [Aliiroseovarius sp. S1123]MCK0170907.1 pilus assembly protein TadG-related protein [Aliiroseovarius sp. S1123]
MTHTSFALRRIRRFRQDENGAITIFGLFLFAAIVLVGGLAIDMHNLMTARTQLQISADLTAHAALYRRDFETDPAKAKTQALALVQASMPKATYGDVIEAKDITFGKWDPSTEKFTPSANSRSAVHVYSTRLNSKSNPVSTFVLRVLGYVNYDMSVQSVFTTFRPTCFREGFVADDRIDVQSNNAYKNGFCIHSNDHVSLNNNNTFETGTVVSMPDIGDVDLPSSGWEKNEGLQAALRDGYYRLRLVNKLPYIIQGLKDRDPEYLPDFIDPLDTVKYLTLKNSDKLMMSDLTKDRVHVVGCGKNGTLTIDEPTAISDVVIVTDCVIKFGQALRIENSVIATTNTDAKSINSSSSFTLGKNDGCADGGGSVLMTLGSVSVASKIHVYGSQIIAKDDISFTANANGIEGASFIAGGEIDGTANGDMGFCGTGMTNIYEAEYFRMAY